MEYKMAKEVIQHDVSGKPYKKRRRIVDAATVKGADTDPDEGEVPVEKTVTLRKTSNEQVEANRAVDVAGSFTITVNGEKTSLTSVLTLILAQLSKLDTHMDVLLERTSSDGSSPMLDTLRGKVAKDALSVPVATEKTYGKGKAPVAPKKAAVAPESGSSTSASVGDFIIDTDGWFKVQAYTKGVYRCAHHQNGEVRDFNGAVRFLRRTKRKNTACWEIV
jgi:hypothetical protein